MSKTIRKVILITVLLVLTACASSPATTGSYTSETAIPSVTDTREADTSTMDLIVFYTNDEHGWMQGEEAGQGAAEISGLWDEVKMEANDIILVLSGGDNWTGPAISTWTDGESMVEVMNAMGYDASTIGNHEFDFGIDELKKRLAEADFPYLSANLRYKNNNEVPTDLGIKPYTILDENGFQLGIIGLTTTLTPGITMAKYVEDFNFIDYETALRDFVPEMRQAGADLIFVTSHVCTGELSNLARNVADLDITLMGAGHCHEKFTGKVGNTIIVSGGSDYQNYALARLTFDIQKEKIVKSEYLIQDNRAGKPDQVVAAVIDKWQKITDEELNTEIGYLENEIPRDSQVMQDLVTKSWLAGYPSADIAITNNGGFRDKIPQGKITLANIISVLPFDNVLYDVTLTGEQTSIILNQADTTAIGGIHKKGSLWVVDVTGESLEPDKVYSILVTDFLYFGGDGFGLLAEFDPEAYNTSIDWRQPLIDWIVDQSSSPENPLDQAIQDFIR